MEDKKMNYVAPSVRVLEVKVENGFAASAQSADWMEGEWGSDVEIQ